MDIAPHQAHILAADGQAQAGTAKPALRVAGLLERLENRLQLVGIDADAGILHLEAQPAEGDQSAPAA